MTVRDPHVDALIEDESRFWKRPGLAVGVIRDRRVIHAAGYGLRDRRRRLSVDPETRFQVGCLTKAMTAAGLASSVDEGMLTWDTAVREILPGFRLQDEGIAAQTTIRDLLCHRVGLPLHDAVAFSPGLTRENLFARLARLELAPERKAFRRDWCYNNLLYVVAGEVLARRTGGTWEDAIAARLFGPLGMARSRFRLADLLGHPNRAEGYTYHQRRYRPRRPRSYDRIASAVGVVSCLDDLLRYVGWLLTPELDPGPDPVRGLPSPARVREMLTSQIADRAPGLAGLEDPGYALGWHTGVARGVRLAYHSGTPRGSASRIVLAPDAGLGIVRVA